MTRSFKISVLVVLTLAALALTGCETENPFDSTTKAEPVIDTAPPAIVTGLSASAADFSVKVSWDANVLDADLYGFMVYRVVWGTPYPMLALPQLENQWIDEAPVSMACTYIVTALDRTGNESARAAVNFLNADEELPDRVEF